MPVRTSRPNWTKTAAGEAALNSPLVVARAPRGTPEPSTRSKKSARPARPAETRLGLAVRLKDGAGGGWGVAGAGGGVGGGTGAGEASNDESASQAGFVEPSARLRPKLPSRSPETPFSDP